MKTENNAPHEQGGGLLPCPFCGGEANAFHDLDDGTPIFVMCENCAGQVPASRKIGAIAAWNRRAPSPALVEALKEAREALKTVPGALTASYGEAYAEWQGRDRAGDKANAIVRKCRDEVAATLAKIDATLSITGEGR